MPSVELLSDLIKTSHVNSYQQKLHWLPISYHILFKYNLITFKSTKFSKPTYLSSLIKTSSLTCGNQLSLSSVRPKKASGRQGFAMASPTGWNRLPQLVRLHNTVIGFAQHGLLGACYLRFPSTLIFVTSYSDISSVRSCHQLALLWGSTF